MQGKEKEESFYLRGQLNERMDGARVNQKNYQIWKTGMEKRKMGTRVAEHCPHSVHS